MTGHGVGDIWHGTFWFSYSFLKEAVKEGEGEGVSTLTAKCR